MNRRLVLLAGTAAALAGCVGGAKEPQLAPDGKPLPKVYFIKSGQEGEVTYRVVDAINALRSAKGAPQLSLDPVLNAAALTHSRDMSVQNRPWHFGSDGSSPISRVQRLGFTGQLLGENISETYQTELETLSAWMAQPDTRDVIMDPRATRMGFAWFQTESGKLWWTLLVAS